MSQRTLRARATKNERKQQESMSDENEFSDDKSMTDFSASEDEWVPNEKTEKESTEEEISEDEDVSLHSGTDGADDSIAVTPNNNWGKSQNRPGGGGRGGKRPLLSPKTREKLYQKYSKKKPDNGNKSLVEILKSSEFKKKKMIKKKTADPCDSDSSGDDYLVDPKKLDLNSDFFKVSTPKVGTNLQEVMQFDCNAGLNLSDSSDGEEIDKNEPKTAQVPLKTDKKNLIATLNEQSIANCFNLKKLEDYSRQIEEAKEQLKNYKTTENGETMDVTNLLALGEGESFEKSLALEKPAKNKRKVFSDSETEWEEVAGNESRVVPDQVEIHVAGNEKKKKNIDWEIEMYIKRQINRVKRENQMNFHKVHVLTTIALGNHINAILNRPKNLGFALSLMQNAVCHPKSIENADTKFYEKFLKWFKSTIKLTSKDNFSPNTFSNLDFSLALQIFTKAAECKRDYVLMFLIFLRAIGIDARLVISANVPPKRPHLNDLVPMSERKGHQKSAKLEEEVKKEMDAYYQGLEQETSRSKSKKSSPKQTEEKSPVVEPELPMPSLKKMDLDEKSKPEEKSVEKVSAKRTKTASPKKLKPTNDLSTSKEKTTPRRTPRSKKTTPKKEEASDDKKKSVSSKKALPEPQKDAEAVNVPQKPTCSKRKNEPTTVSPTENKKAKINEIPEAKISKRSTRKALATMNIPQLDGLNDEPRPRKMTRRQEQKLKNQQAFESPKSIKASPRAPFTPKHNQNKGKVVAANKRKIEKTDKLITKSKPVPENMNDSDLEAPAKSIKPKKPNSKAKPKAQEEEQSSDSDSDLGAPSKSIKPKKSKVTAKSKPQEVEKEKESSGSEYEDENSESEYEAPKKKTKSASTSKKSTTVAKKSKKTSQNSIKEQKGFDYWVEVYDADKENWLAIDLFSGKIGAVDSVSRAASHPICYVFAWNKENKIKDVSPRYCPNWNTVKRKHRVESEWLDETLAPFKAKKTDKDANEDKELDKLGSEHPMPTTITEFKNHPLYVLQRHLLKFEALYPPDVPTLGFLRGEPIYARECVYTLMTREKWYKEGQVVRPKEEPYRVLKHMKWDRATNKFLKDQPLDVFGKWQTDRFDPPTAENGIVPRNEYGNVELFQSFMLPKKTVHLQLPGLNRVCKRLNIDCASAIIGFEAHKMRSHPIYDGFVVCEEFSERVVEEWYKDQEEEERKENEKREKRIYDNWKKLIRGLFIRRKLQNKYNFDNLG